MLLLFIASHRVILTQCCFITKVFFIALSDLPILPFLFLNFLAWVLLLLQTLVNFLNLVLHF
jgi:hypothetical protein